MPFFDLNGFKQINDGYGHAEGDRALAGFANVLTAAMRETEVLARLGGDEFVALVVGAEDGERRANHRACAVGPRSVQPRTAERL